jgi:hypothetical protein
MSAQGGSEEPFEERLLGILERTAKAQEDLIRLATEEREVGETMIEPPFCPHCGRLNPAIRSEGGRGDFNEYILIAHCENCNNTFLAVPANGWNVYRNEHELKEGRSA